MRQLGHVHVAHGAKAHLDAAVRDGAEQECEAHAGDRAGVLHDPVEVVRRGVVTPQCVGRDRHPCQPDVRLDHECLQHLGHQPHAALGRARVDRLVDRLGVHAALQQRTGDPQDPRARVREPERPGVRQDPHVEGPRRLGREWPPDRAGEVEDELGRRRRLGRHQAWSLGERADADVMVEARHRVGPFDRVLKVAEPAEVRDVEDHHHVRRLDLLRRAAGMIGAVRDQKLEPLGDGRGVRDGRGDPAVREQVPQRHLAPYAVTVRVDVRRQGNAPTRREHGRDRPRRAGAVGGNRNAVQHPSKIRREEMLRED